MAKEIMASFKIMNHAIKKLPTIKGMKIKRRLTTFINKGPIMAKGKIIKQNVLTTIVEYKGKHIKRHSIKHCVTI